MMHPCPFCHSEALTLNERVVRTRRVCLIAYDTTPTAWDYEIHEEHDNDLTSVRATCDHCNRAFVFNLDAYQARWPHPQDECPYDHESGYAGCEDGCPACAWEAQYGARSWPVSSDQTLAVTGETL